MRQAIIIVALLPGVLGLFAAGSAVILDLENSGRGRQLAAEGRQIAALRAEVRATAAEARATAAEAAALQASSAHGTVITCRDLAQLQSQVSYSISATDSLGGNVTGSAYPAGGAPWLPAHCYKS